MSVPDITSSVLFNTKYTINKKKVNFLVMDLGYTMIRGVNIKVGPNLFWLSPTKKVHKNEKAWTSGEGGRTWHSPLTGFNNNFISKPILSLPPGSPLHYQRQSKLLSFSSSSWYISDIMQRETDCTCFDGITMEALPATWTKISETHRNKHPPEKRTYFGYES